MIKPPSLISSHRTPPQRLKKSYHPRVNKRESVSKNKSSRKLLTRINWSTRGSGEDYFRAGYLDIMPIRAKIARMAKQRQITPGQLNDLREDILENEYITLLRKRTAIARPQLTGTRIRLLFRRLAKPEMRLLGRFRKKLFGFFSYKSPPWHYVSFRDTFFRYSPMTQYPLSSFSYFPKKTGHSKTQVKKFNVNQKKDKSGFDKKNVNLKDQRRKFKRDRPKRMLRPALLFGLRRRPINHAWTIFETPPKIYPKTTPARFHPVFLELNPDFRGSKTIRVDYDRYGGMRRYRTNKPMDINSSQISVEDSRRMFHDYFNKRLSSLKPFNFYNHFTSIVMKRGLKTKSINLVSVGLLFSAKKSIKLISPQKLVAAIYNQRQVPVEIKIFRRGAGTSKIPVPLKGQRRFKALGRIIYQAANDRIYPSFVMRLENEMTDLVLAKSASVTFKRLENLCKEAIINRANLKYVRRWLPL